jgi:hypothetical protein
MSLHQVWRDMRPKATPLKHLGKQLSSCRVTQVPAGHAELNPWGVRPVTRAE